MSLLRLSPFISSKDLFAPLDTPSLSFMPTTTGSSFLDEDEVINTEKEYRVSMDIPGVKASDINLTVQEDGSIRVEGIRRRVSNNGETTKKQRFVKAFKANPHTCDLSSIRANLSDGVLLITAPKRPKTTPLNIAISTEPHVDPVPPKKQLLDGDNSKQESTNQKIDVQTVDPKNAED